VYLTNDATVDNFQFLTGGDWAGDITNISLVEVSSDFAFDRASSATRINSSGLVQDMQSITEPELVLNGDFEELGDEEVTNGTFDTETDWTFANITFSPGAILFDSVGDTIFQNFSDTINKIYKITVTKTGEGTLRYRTGYAGSDGLIRNIPESGIVYFTSTSDTNRIQIYGDISSVNATLNSVSVKQVNVDSEGNDIWTLGTGWSIEDGKLVGTSVSTQFAQQSFTFIDGNTYKITFDITGADTLINDTSFRLPYDGTLENIRYLDKDSPDGTYSHTFVAGTSSILYLGYIDNGTYTGTIDNISVKDITFSTDVDLARINYDSNGDDGHILLEPTSANLIPYSEDTTNWSTQVNSVLATSNQAISPDGTLNADKLIPANGNVQSNGGRYISFSSTAETDYSVSIFVKQAEYRYVTFSYGSTSAYGFHFDLQDGVIIQELSNAQYSDISREVKSFDNGWYRLKISLTDNNTNPTRFISVRPANERPTATNNNYSTTGDGTSGIYAWGFQLEALSYATSYIPTLTGSPVTRAAETLTGSGNSTLINSTEGVLYLDIAMLSEDDKDSDNQIFLSNGSSNNRVGILINADGDIRAQIRDNEETITSRNVTILDQSESGVDTAAFNKIAILYKSGQNKLFVNGSRITDTNFDSFVFNYSFKKLNFDNGSGTANYFRGKVKAVAVFNEALEDDELELLTGVTNYGSFSGLASANGYTII
jgi:hypothetical protein